MGNERAEELIRRYLEGTATPQEEALLESWYIAAAQSQQEMPVEFSVMGNNVLLKKKRSGNGKTISDIPIHGRVVDSAGLPLLGVTVMNYREKKGTETDTGGVFTLPGQQGDVFRFSFVGFRDRDVIVGDQPSIWK